VAHLIPGVIFSEVKMNPELKIVYFEAGKIAASTSKVFMIMSFMLAIFLAIPTDNELAIPFLQLKFKYHLSIGVVLLAHSFLFYRTIAAINYERLLGDCLQKENEYTKEMLWRLSYPSVFNFHQHSSVFVNDKYHKVIMGVSVVILMLIAFVIPISAIIIMLVNTFSGITIVLSFLSLIMYLLTIIVLMKNYNMKSRNGNSGETQLKLGFNAPVEKKI